VVEYGPFQLVIPGAEVPHPFRTGNELLARCQETGISMSQLMLENEQTWRSEMGIRMRLLGIWSVMQACVRRGFTTEGTLH
jgi:L-serine dehydratase